MEEERIRQIERALNISGLDLDSVGDELLIGTFSTLRRWLEREHECKKSFCVELRKDGRELLREAEIRE